MTDKLRKALEGLVEIIDKAGLINLKNGVQLGATSWYVKAYDRIEYARAALAEAPQVGCDPCYYCGGVRYMRRAKGESLIRCVVCQDQDSGPYVGGGGEGDGEFDTPSSNGFDSRSSSGSDRVVAPTTAIKGPGEGKHMSCGIFVVTNRTTWTKVAPVVKIMRKRGHGVQVIGGGTFAETHPEKCDRVISATYRGNHPNAMTHTVAAHTERLADIFKDSCDYVVTTADRFETLGTAIAAAYQNIPLIHIQGGEVTGTIDDKVRNAITQLADYHIVTNTAAEEELRHMGVARDKIQITGCPSISSIPAFSKASPNFGDYGKGVDIEEGDNYGIVMFHPDTSYWAEANHLTDILWQGLEKHLLKLYNKDLKILWVEPNNDAGSDSIRKWLNVTRNYNATFQRHVRTVEHLPMEMFYQAMYHCDFILGNSSVAIREGAFLGTPAINIGSRQDGRVAAKNVVHVPHFYTGHDVERALDHIDSASFEGRLRDSSDLYGTRDSAARVADAIELTGVTNL
jgi:UDP-hydrolysing UDP-N-acetyl-D-glucosamine 2-epimerase